MVTLKNLFLEASVIYNKVFIDTLTQYAIDASYQVEMGGGTDIFLGIKAGTTTKKQPFLNVPPKH